MADSEVYLSKLRMFTERKTMFFKIWTGPLGTEANKIAFKNKRQEWLKRFMTQCHPNF